jgi:hypothetical protein
MTAAEKARKIYGKHATSMNGNAYDHQALVADIETALIEAKREAFEDAAQIAALNMAEQTAFCGWTERARGKAIDAAAEAIRAKKGELK